MEAQEDVSLYRLSRADMVTTLMRYPQLEAIWESLKPEMFESGSASAGAKSSEKATLAPEEAELAITREFVDQVGLAYLGHCFQLI